MINFYDFTLETLTETLEKEGFKAFNAKQLFQWIYQKETHDFNAMTNLSKPLRAWLEKHVRLPRLTLHEQSVAPDQTTKCAFVLNDGEVIETVLMHHSYGKSICVTTQVGCNMGCAFCASGLHKKTRNLTQAEMILQVQGVMDLTGIKPTHLVVMGIGEPFDNFDAVMDFIDTVNSPYAYAIGKRHITVSTSGLAPQIERFGERQTQVNLAISLHAPNDALRSRLMPINKKYPLKTLMKSVDRYHTLTNRRVTYEYIMLKDVNDSLNEAKELIALLKGKNAYVNLIPYNPVKEFSFECSDWSQIKRFYDALMQGGINATTRKEKGEKVNAACGQLRHQTIKEAPHGFKNN